MKFIIQESFSENFDTSSIATSDSVNQIEVSYDTSEDSDESEDNCPSVHEPDLETECLPDETKLWIEKVPKALHSPYKITSENDLKMMEIEKNSALMYHKLLRNRMFRLNSIRSAVEIDQKIHKNLANTYVPILASKNLSVDKGWMRSIF